MQIGPEYVNAGLAVVSAVTGLALGGGGAVLFIQKIAGDTVKPLERKVEELEGCVRSVSHDLEQFYRNWPTQLNGTYMRTDVWRPQVQRLQREVENISTDRRGPVFHEANQEESE